MFIATLIAAEHLSGGDISAAEDRLAAVGIRAFARSWIEPDTACDLLFSIAPERARAALDRLEGKIDAIVQPEADRRRRLLVADMDSTMITVECIDELADYAGRKAEVADVTEQAMRGELDFAVALDARVALLAGLEETLLARCHAERVIVSPGARALVRTMRREGAGTLLVSGGFTHFADKVAAAIGFERALANRLEMDGGRLSGTVARPIVDAAAKRDALLEAAAARGVPAEQALAIGDGANDVPMLEAAGLGIAYRAKPAAEAAADACLRHTPLSSLLYARGLPRSSWESDAA